MTIIISACNADVSVSMARILKSDPAYKNQRLVGLAPDGKWPAQAYFDEIYDIPYVNDKNYPDVLVDVVHKEKPNFFIPFSEAELAYFSKNMAILSDLNCSVVINKPALLNIFLDKLTTASFLFENGIKVPETYLPEDVGKENLPVIVKPRCSAGSKEMSVWTEMEQKSFFLKRYADRKNDFVAQQWIDEPEHEYTCAVWQFGGHLRTCILRRKLQGGMTGVAHVENVACIEDALRAVANAVNEDCFINVQLRVKNNVPYIFEINPRFSSTVMMRHKIGFQDLLWTLDYLNNVKIPEPWDPPVGTSIYRSSDEIIARKEA